MIPSLEALLAQDLEEPYEVIVVESGALGCGEVVHRKFPGVRFVRSRRRLIPGEARNRGVAAARGRWVAFCSDDCVTGADWLRLRVAKHRAGFDVVGGAVTNGVPLHPVGIADYYVEHTALMPSAGILARQAVPHLLSYDRGLLARAGPFPEDTPTGEDSVLNRRCVELGATVGYEPRAAFAHHGPTRLRGFLAHHHRHGRGLARCIELHGHESPLGEGRARAFLAFPLLRWARGLRRVGAGRPAEVPLYLAVSPLIAWGHLAVAAGAWRERSTLGQARAARRSRSGSMPQREPTAASSGVSSQRSGRSSPS